MSGPLQNFRARLIGDSLHYLPSVLIPAFITVLGVAIFTRWLGVDAYGVYAVAGAIVTILTVGCAEWIAQSLLRYLPERPDDAGRRELVASTLGLTFATLIAILGAGVVAFLATRGLATVGPLVLPVTLLLAAEVLFAIASAEVQARMRARRLSAFRIVGSILRFALAVGFMVWVARGVPWLLLGAGVGRGFIAVVMTLAVMRADGRWIRPRLEGAVTRAFVAYGTPMIGWTVCSQVLGLSDRFVIGAFRGSGDAGIYSANYSLVTMGFGLIGAPLITAAHPLIVTAWRDDRSRIGALIASCTRLYLLAAVPALVLLIACRRELVSLLLAEGFHEGAAVIPLLAFGSVVWGLGRYANKGLELAEQTRTMFALILVTTLANIALNLIFVPRYGYPAAAVTTLACNALYPSMVYVASRRGVAWQVPWSTLLWLGAAGLVVALLAAWVRTRLDGFAPVWIIAGVSAAGLAAYVAMVWGWMRLRPVRGET